MHALQVIALQCKANRLGATMQRARTLREGLAVGGPIGPYDPVRLAPPGGPLPGCLFWRRAWYHETSAEAVPGSRLREVPACCAKSKSTSAAGGRPRASSASRT